MNIAERNYAYIFISGEGVNGVQTAENAIAQIVNTAVKKLMNLAQIMKTFVIHVVNAITPHAHVVAMSQMISQDVKIAELHIVTQMGVEEMVSNCVNPVMWGCMEVMQIQTITRVTQIIGKDSRFLN